MLQRVRPRSLRRSRFRRFLQFSLAAALLGSLTLGATGLWIDQQASADERCAADVIVVLGAAVWPGEQASPALWHRTRHAVTLFHEGHAPFLLLTGGLGANPPAEAEVMRRLARDWGVPEERIITDAQSRTTAESARRSAALMAERGLSTALLVSDGFHLPRAGLSFRRQGVITCGSPALESPVSTIPRLRLYHVTRESLAWWAYLLGIGSRQ